MNIPQGPVTVGDWVLLDPAQEKIVHLLERSTLFRRKAPGTDRRVQLIAANVDTLFVVSSCNLDFNEARLERYLAIGRDAGVLPIIVLTKADLCEDASAYVRRACKLSAGLLVEAVNAQSRDSLRCLDAWLGKGQTIALLGSSGVTRLCRASRGRFRRYRCGSGSPLAETGSRGRPQPGEPGRAPRARQVNRQTLQKHHRRCTAQKGPLTLKRQTKRGKIRSGGRSG